MILNILAFFFWDPQREMCNFNIPLLNRPILWYGFFFALGFFIAYFIMIHVLQRKFSKKEAKYIVENISIYVIVGTVLGARLGDILFYQDLSEYIHHPLAIFKVWEGGLASHGGVAGVIIGICLCSHNLKKTYPTLNWIRLLDYLSIPSALVAAFIRLGNFFNQEILGKPSSLPWAIIFGHPAGGEAPVPRHPAQLYESLFYLFLCGLLYFVWRKSSFFQKEGKLAGLFLFLLFTFRFFIEFLKEEQSLRYSGVIDMGQILSIPFILFSVWLLFKKRQNG